MHPNLQKYLETLLKLGIALTGLLTIYLTLFIFLPRLAGLLGTLPGYLSPFIIAVFLAFFIDPLVDRIEKWSRLSRGWAVLIVLLSVWGGIGLLLTLAVSRLIRELIQLSGTISYYSSDLTSNYSSLIQQLTDIYLRLNLPPEVIPNNLGTIINALQRTLELSVRGLLRFLGTLPEVFTVLLIATLATFFISRDRDLILKTVLDWVPEAWVKETRGLGRNLSQAIAGFLRAQAILITNTALLSIVGLSILGVDYALTMGLLIGLVDLLPVLGPGTVFIPWIIWQFVSGHLAFGCGLLVLYGIIVLIRQLFEPKIVAQSIGLHPLATLFALYVGLKTMGIVGMVLGPVILVVFQAARRAGLWRNLFGIRTK
ncbi:MAG: sporulation integral membrane protein YtvI [Firmicutes bacterium]|nr:sporulation integral membrane protein YtvI [Bacillota bacterium]